MIRKKEIITFICLSTELGIIALALAGAFSERSKKKIWKRDEGVCQNSGVSSLEANLECAHWDHTRNENYNDPSNGRLLSPAEHYKDHFYRPLDDLGLTYDQNIWAIEEIWRRLAPWERRNLPHPTTYKVRKSVPVGVFG